MNLTEGLQCHCVRARLTKRRKKLVNVIVDRLKKVGGLLSNHLSSLLARTTSPVFSEILRDVGTVTVQEDLFDELVSGRAIEKKDLVT